MRIGIELGVHSPEEYGGVWQLLKGVLETLGTTYSNHDYVLFCSPSHQSLADSLPATVKILTLPRDRFFTRVDQYAYDERIEVLFRRYPVEDDLVFPLSRQIFLIPDIQHEEFPEFFTPDELRSRRLAFTRVLSGSGAIATISAFSRQKLVARPETKCADVFLMSPALQREHQQYTEGDLAPMELDLIPEGLYFFYPANLWPHKNHRRILEAFDLFRRSTGYETQLVLTGNPSGWLPLRQDFPTLPVRHLGYVRPQVLRLLIERAAALVFFSLYEGFGIPLLEAFNVGTPVICSNTTSLPEVGGDAVLSCDPTNIEEMSLLMRRILEDTELRAKLAYRGKERLSQFSWKASAASLLAACERVSAKPFSLSYEVVLRVTQKLHKQLRASEEDSAGRLVVIEETRQKLVASESDRQDRLAVIERLDAEVKQLHTQLGEIEADRAARLSVIERLDAEVKQLHTQIGEIEADRAARLSVIERLDAEVKQLHTQIGEIEADRAARLSVIERLDAEVKQLHTQIGEIEADRAARLKIIEELEEELKANKRGIIGFLLRMKLSQSKRKRRNELLLP